MIGIIEGHIPLIERVMEYFKDRTECFDDYYAWINHKSRNNCDPSHVYNWIKLFIYYIIQESETQYSKS